MNSVHHREWPQPDTSDDDDRPNTRTFGRHRKHSESEDSYKPNKRGKKIVHNTRNRGKQNKHYRDPQENSDDSERNEISKRTRAKTQTNNFSESDDEPLVNCINTSVTSSDSDEKQNYSLRSNISLDETSQSSSRPSRGQKKTYAESNTDDDDDDDENEEGEEEDEDEEEAQLPQRSARAKRFNYRKLLEYSDESEEDHHLRSRRGKRPHYNEDSEDSNGNPTYTRSKRSRQQAEDSESETNVISISSRGRIRKLTARAKAFLRD